MIIDTKISDAKKATRMLKHEKRVLLRQIEEEQKQKQKQN